MANYDFRAMSKGIYKKKRKTNYQDEQRDEAPLQRVLLEKNGTAKK